MWIADFCLSDEPDCDNDKREWMPLEGAAVPDNNRRTSEPVTLETRVQLSQDSGCGGTQEPTTPTTPISPITEICHTMQNI